MKKETAFWIILALAALLFSSSLMWQTFSYDSATSSMRIAQKAWSDFGAHIPLIRSFSLGANWPPESPLFPGLPIQYHFLFYFLVGVLEKAGLRIDFALNIPSIIGLTSLIVLIAVLTKKLFSRLSVAAIATLLFCFNGSLSFISFFTKHPLSVDSVHAIVTNSTFPSFGPWDGGLVSAFWNMNIYTNQRHLGLSYALVLGVLLAALYIPTKSQKQRGCMACGIALGMATLLFLNQAAALITALWLLWIFCIQKKSRLPLMLAAVISIPSIFLYTRIIGMTEGITFDPGYLAHAPLTIQSVVNFWWQNLGLSLILIPFGFAVSPKKVKLFFSVPMLALCIVPNLWRFSPDMINNHKFFNFFIIMGNMLTAYGLVTLFDWLKKSSHRMIHIAGYAFVGVCLFFLTLSGIIDLFPIFTDTKEPLVDIPANEDATFFLEHTPPDAVILNSTWFYHPALLAGRKIFSGYTYFTWSYGYNQAKRENEQKAVYEATDKKTACALLNTYAISFVELANKPERFLKPNYTLFTDEFTPIYENKNTGIRVFDVKASCDTL